jgi:putative phage-type endonuclease
MSLKRKRSDESDSDIDDEIIIKRRRLEEGIEDTIKYYANIIPGSNEWKLARDQFDLNGSDVAAAVGVGFKSPQKLWREKKGIEEPENLDNNPIVQWGVEKEPEARWEFEAGFLLNDLPGYVMTQPGITVYREDPRYAASLDNLVFDPEDPDNPDKRIVVEYKCPVNHYPFVPIHYMVQVQVQMEYANANSAYFYVWRPDRSVFTIVKRNKKFFDKFLYPKMRKFSLKLNDEQYTPARAPNGEKERLRNEIMSYFPEVYGDRKK